VRRLTFAVTASRRTVTRRPGGAAIDRRGAELGVWHRACSRASRSGSHHEEETMKPTMLVLALMAVLVGLGACAKYPVVRNAGAPSPTASAPAPTR
jgi:hypothetical protein